MSTPSNFTDYGTINTYLPAVLKENKSGWIIEYYVLHPVTKELTRKQIRLQNVMKRYRLVKDARAHIAVMISNLNQKLSGGWNPFFTSEDARMYETLSDVADKFLKEKEKENRESTYRSYQSFCRMLLEWGSRQNPKQLCSMFTRINAVMYMDYMYNERNVQAYTYNNHIKMGRAFFNWAKEKCYCKENPFEHVKTKEKPRKSRKIIPAEVRADIIEDLKKYNPELLLISKLMFDSLIRRTEVTLLKIGDIDLINKTIRVDQSIAKNKNTRFATINQDIIDTIVSLNLDRYPKSYYLFSEKLKPGAVKLPPNYVSKQWAKMRKRLKLPLEMQLYSLRDTGIHEMLKSGIDNLSVMQHADHSSLEMTTLYGNHHDPNLTELIYKRAPKF